ncbi:hypothetical protein LEN26_001800 [Aphanomyces euteiches]|nr:hypothetical protein LEN26_001800 [Aphanomyces euteiches]
MKGETPDELHEYLVQTNKMSPFSTLDEALTLPLGRNEIHVLVVVPERQVDSLPKKKQRLDGRVFFSLQGIQAVDPASCQPNVWLDCQEISKVTDFPADYFVRKESIDVFHLLKARTTRQIVLEGSPGVGKSLLLVLSSFWMAIEGKKCVVLVRLVEGKGLSMIFLNGQNLSDNWKLERMSADEIAPLVQQCMRRYPKCELCLDGFQQSFLKNHIGVLMEFSVLAASGPYKTKQDDAGVLALCLVPFWSFSDLKLVGQHYTWDDESMEKKYYFSGGSLRLFLVSEMDAKIAAELAFCKVDLASVKLLNTQNYSRFDKQIGWIQMATLDTSDLSNYNRPGKWSYVVCSGFALRKLGDRVTREYYKDLCHKAYMIHDVGLFGIAFENYFHAMAREKQSIQLKVREYDSTKLREYSVLTFTSAKHLLKGKDQTDFEILLKTWPSELDYWYPDSRCPIDSIAKLDGEYLLLQLTRSTTHSIDTEYLETISKCFPPNSSIAYMAVVPNKAICDEFRLRPADPVKQIPLRVAYVDDGFFTKFGNSMEG